jgi:hypothetical protein
MISSVHDMTLYPLTWSIEAPHPSQDHDSQENEPIVAFCQWKIHNWMPKQHGGPRFRSRVSDNYTHLPYFLCGVSSSSLHRRLATSRANMKWDGAPRFHAPPYFTLITSCNLSRRHDIYLHHVSGEIDYPSITWNYEGMFFGCDMIPWFADTHMTYVQSLLQKHMKYTNRESKGCRRLQNSRYDSVIRLYSSWISDTDTGANPRFQSDEVTRNNVENGVDMVQISQMRSLFICLIGSLILIFTNSKALTGINCMSEEMITESNGKAKSEPLPTRFVSSHRLWL